MKPGTKSRILDSTELLIAEHGPNGVSLRSIAETAGVNLAAVNYHFGSKEALIHAVFARRLGPVNVRRLAMLDEVLAANPERPELRGVLRAMVLPILETAFLPPSEGNPVQLGSLMIRLYTEPAKVVERGFNEQMASTAERFVAALHQALPHVDRPTLLWRTHFCVGAIVHTMHGRAILAALSKGEIVSDNAEAALAQMLPFLEAGLRAGVSNE
jgi:AcrR family transcriptional regulator